ncbi:MAG: type I restriction-modification enzyme R subunit C-terminal domain-containing protein [Bacteroidia bacterium]
MIISTGQQLTLQEYRNYVRQCVLQAVTEHITLRDLWIDSNRRKDFLETLRKARAEPQVLDRALHKEDTDTFDLLCHVTFGDPIRTRNERVTAFQNREQAFLQRHSPKDQEVLFELLDKYRVDGIDNLEYCHLIPFPPLAERRRIVAHLRAVQEKVRALKEAQARKDLQRLEEAMLDHAFRGKL